MGISWTFIFSGIFIAYMVWSLNSLVVLFYPDTCDSKSTPGSICLNSFIKDEQNLELTAYTSTKKRPYPSDMKFIWKFNNFSLHDTVESHINVSIPLRTRNNGSLWIFIYVCPIGEDPLSTNLATFDLSLLTIYSVPATATYNLVEGSTDDSLNSNAKVTHWQSKLSVSIMNEPISFNAKSVPGEMSRMFKLTSQKTYLPIIYINQLSPRIRDLIPVNKTSNKLALSITYAPISVGKLRLWLHMQESLQQLRNLGFTEKDVDDVKGIFEDTNLTFLLLTFLVSAFHMLFDFLAFKNDISFWKNRDTMAGLSTRVVIWRCASTIIIFLYLLDENTSYLVLIPCGIGSLIEIWKLKKAFKIHITRIGFKLKISWDKASEQEKQTEEFDKKAMKYLCYLLYPLCFLGAIYSLIYNPHKSWYSWTINSMVNGVYGFGFLFMLPQLFLNYKFKSVAHLPWKAFMYKAFNTFIDDLFAFIIVMPTSHRLACFRDDIVFLIYLYQRWLYPVDKSRVNEFGQSFDGDGPSNDNKKNK